MKFLYYGIISVLGLCAGMFFASGDGVFTANRSATQSPTEELQFGLKSKKEVFSNQEYYDFYLRVHSGTCDYAKEIADLLAGGYSFGKDPRLGMLLKQWGRSAPLSALEAMEMLPKERQDYRYFIFQGWAERNPEELAYYYRDNRNRLYGRNKNIMAMAVRSWAQTAPADAAEYLSSLNTRERKKGTMALLEALPTGKAGEYGRIVQKLPPGMFHDSGILSSFMDKWASEDPGAAVEWMETLPPEQQKGMDWYRELKHCLRLIPW